MTIRVGIAGLGFGAQVHLAACQRVPGIVVTALADNGSGRAASLAAAQAQSVRAFQSAEDMLGWDGIDAAVIATPPMMHEKLAELALAAGKHVLCEKPVGRSRAISERLQTRAGAGTSTIGVAFEYRYESGIAALAALVRSGRIGQVERASVHWLTSGALNARRPWSWHHDIAQGGGVMIDWGSHVVDYLSRFGLGRAISVIARDGLKIATRADRAGRMQTVTAPDSCDMTIAYDGAVAQIAISSASSIALGHRIELFGAWGRAVLHHAPPFTADSKSLTVYDRDGKPEILPLPNDGSTDDDRIAAMHGLLTDFAAAIAARHNTLPGLADAARAWSILEAAQASARDGGGVRCLPTAA
jgi:predicted dehydrogenase